MAPYMAGAATPAPVAPPSSPVPPSSEIGGASGGLIGVVSEGLRRIASAESLVALANDAAGGGGGIKHSASSQSLESLLLKDSALKHSASSQSLVSLTLSHSASTQSLEGLAQAADAVAAAPAASPAAASGSTKMSF